MSTICLLPFRPHSTHSGLRARLLPALALATVVGFFVTTGRVAAAPQPPPAEKEHQYLSVLATNAAPGEKAVACKELAIYGSKNAVPALAPLLADPELASWARIALEAIPDPACDAALREAAGTLQGKLLVGVINSIAVRRDAEATSTLIKQLKNPDPDVASAAAVALGHIGSAKAAKALSHALPKAAPALRSAIAQGCILCAENFLAHSNSSQAVKLYDTVRKADVPTQRMLEATRGAILARGSAGLPLLLEQLRAADKAHFGIGLRTARELPGRAVTEALVAELAHCASNRQAYLLLAIGDRTDAAVLPAVVNIVRTGQPSLRLVGINLLDRLGDVSTVPALLEAATSADAASASAAQVVLARLPGAEVDKALLDDLAVAGPFNVSSLHNILSADQPKRLQVLIPICTQRHLERALPTITSATADTDPAIRAAAVQALGALGEVPEAARLVNLLSETQSESARSDIETALIAIGARKGPTCVPALLPLTENHNSALRTVGLHALASAGGPKALAAINAAVQDADEAVQDEAVRALSTWPSNWPEDTAAAEPLLALAKTGKKPSYQVLGLRGYLELLQGDKQLKPEEKVARLKELQPLLQRPEEKRQTIAILEANPTAGALELLLPLAEEPAVAEDACSGLLKLASKKIRGVSNEQRQQALQAVTAHSKDEARIKKAQQLLQTSAKQS